MARFSITAMAADSSGWAKASACDHRVARPGRARPRRRAESGQVARPARAARRPLHGRAGTRRGARSGRPDVRGFQRHRDPRRPQFPERPHRDEALRREHHDRRRRPPPAAIRRGVRWRRHRAQAAGAGGKRRRARDRLQPAGRGSCGRRAHGPRLSRAERDRRSSGQHRDCRRRHVASNR